MKDPLEGLTWYFHDANGNLTMVRDAKGYKIEYEYDDRDRIIKMIDQLDRVEKEDLRVRSTHLTADGVLAYTDRQWHDL